jgi:HK97 family phage major capsid protein
MRELQAQIKTLRDEAEQLITDKDFDAAGAKLDEIDALQKEYEVEARMFTANKSQVPEEPVKTEKSSGFKILAKMLGKAKLTDAEKSALVTGTNAANGEEYLLPEDIKLEINELRKTYISARDIVTVEQTDALSGSVNYEAGAPAGLTAFDDGAEISEETAPKFVRKLFTIGFFGKLIPISRILLGAEKAGLMGYINRWFVKNAIITENAAIFAQLKAGYNGGAPKAVKGWKALKKSINVDLDPSCKLDGIIVTNQSGFAALDAEEDADGRPVLQPNPAHPTEKLFQGLPVKVFPDAQLANIDATHFPMFYGATKAGCTFVEYQALTFDISEHFLFNKNQNCLRVTEGFDVMEADTSAYIYGSFEASEAVAG